MRAAAAERSAILPGWPSKKWTPGEYAPGNRVTAATRNGAYVEEVAAFE